MPEYCHDAVIESLRHEYIPLMLKSWLRAQRRFYLRRSWSILDPQIALIVSRRAGLTMSSRNAKLDEIGDKLGVTRERVRQLEQDFWRRLDSGCPGRRARFAVALVCDLLARAGSVIANRATRRANWMRFVARCVGIPVAEPRHLGLVIVGTRDAELKVLFPSRVSEDWLDKSALESNLALSRDICLGKGDAQTLLARAADAWRRKLSVTERIAITLSKNGRPAHYSKVTDLHNRLFPDFGSTEQRIHAALNREECGVVWIGARGMFALRKWGYERPTKGLYDTVADIVGSIYLATKKPVTWNAILAEMGRHRRAVNRNSVMMAACFNPRIEKLGGGLFVPRESIPIDPEPPPEDHLDRALREFGSG